MSSNRHSDPHLDEQEISSEEGPSKSALKREMKSLQDLGHKLAELGAAKLSPIEFPESWLDQISILQKLKPSAARNRQLRHFSKLLKSEPELVEQIRDKLAEDSATRRMEIQAHHQLEQWRDRLILDGDRALTEYLDKHPRIDRQQLRQLIRKSREEQQAGATTFARRLFRFLRDHSETG